MEDIKKMMRSMQEQQQIMMQSMQEQLSEVKQQLGGVQQQLGGVQQQQGEMATTIRMANWEALRWRRIEWTRIPYPSRVPVLPYLSVEDNVAFNRAMRNKHDRKHFVKSYKGKRLPAFDRYVYTDANNFAVLRWVMKKGGRARTDIAPEGAGHRGSRQGAAVAGGEWARRYRVGVLQGECSEGRGGQ